jgi:hypothetical protein
MIVLFGEQLSKSFRSSPVDPGDPPLICESPAQQAIA